MMKFMLMCLVPFVVGRDFILTKKNDNNFGTMNIKNFNDEHNIEQLANIGDLSIYKTSGDNFKRYEKTLSAFYEMEEEQTYNVNWNNQGFILIKDAPWHLGRIINQDLPLSTIFPYGTGQCHQNSDYDIHSYVIDTGIDVEHQEFEGRATWLKDFTGESRNNLNSHATHCAGLIGSKTFGVCKDAKLFSVRVLDSQGSGSTSGVISGIQYTFKRHQEQNKMSVGKVRSIASVSLGGGFSNALNRIVQETIKDPNFYFVAASGNENSDSCKTSPASAKGIFSVMASDKYDQRAYFSNFGKCSDIYSPGVNIESTVPGDDTAVYSGTSMSVPILVGVLNHYMDMFPELNMKTLKEKVLKDASKDKILGNMKATNNLLIYLNREL